MNGVTFGQDHSYDDLSLILNSKEIEAPEPKTDTLDIPGADGEVDFTEYFGAIRYKNRKITFEFTTIVPRSQFLELYSSIQNKLHGRKMKIILDDDNNFYYMGRLTCDKWKANKRLGTLKIEANCEPYKYKLYETVINVNIGADPIEIACSNLRKNVVPTIVVSAQAQIEFNGATYSLSSGTYKIPGIEFVEGINILNITGEGNITIKYQEAGL